MANVLFLTLNKTDACSFYRSSGIIKDLQRKTDDDITIAQWNQIDMNWATIINFDIIMFQRPFSKEALDLCNYIKETNVKLWVDYDDNLLCVPPENKAHWVYDKLTTKETIKKILSLADVVSVTNEDLKQSYLEFNKNIWVIPNAFNDSIFKRGILPKRSNIVAWRGTETHIWDVQSYGRAIAKATAEFPKKQFLYVGYYPWFLPKTENQFVLEDMDLILYFKNLFRMAPLVMQVPLVDELFNRCKSEIAFLEGAYFGAICVTPHWWQAPGAISYTDEKSYYEALRSILSGEVDVKSQNEISWEYIMDERRLSKVNVKRIELINSLS